MWAGLQNLTCSKIWKILLHPFADFSVGSSVMPVAVGAALSLFLLVPSMPLLGLVCHVLFRAGRQPLRVLAAYFEMSWKELTFQETHASFQPAALLLGPQGAVLVSNLVDDH